MTSPQGGGAAYDISASQSTSTTATSGAQLGNFTDLFGDTIAGAPKPTPPWVWLALAAAAVAILFGWWVWQRR